MLVFWPSLDLGHPDHQMFWAARFWGAWASSARQSSWYLAYLATLHPSTWVSRTLQWILYWPHRPCAYESRAPRQTRPGKAAFVHTGLWQASSLCSALYDDIPCFKGDASGPLFLVVMSGLSPALFLQIGSGRLWLQLRYRAISPPIAFVLELLLSLLAMGFWINGPLAQQRLSALC